MKLCPRTALLALILSSIFLLACSKQPQPSTQFESAIFSEDYDISYLIPNDTPTGRFTPSQDEVNTAVGYLQESLNGNTKIDGLDQYKAQVFGYLNEQGNRLLWVNYVCSTQADENWKIVPTFVDDGGNCYFNVKVNLDTKEVFDLEVNSNG